jgi:uncharacterized protein
MYRYYCSLLLLLSVTLNVIAQPPEIDPNGYNVFFHANGNIASEGYMRDGQPDGFWKTYFEDGAIKSEGNRENFELDSIWNFYKNDGQLDRTISFLKGKKSGFETVYNGDLVLEEIPYLNGQRSGEGRYYYDSGELYRRVNFENDLEEGKGFEYAEDGRVITFLNYKSGFIRSIEKVNRLNIRKERTGYWVLYWPNELVQEEGTWTNGVRNGVFKFFKKNGDLDRIEVYSGGEIIEGADAAVMLDIRKEYYEDGTLRMIGSYREGSKQGVFREYDKSGEIINSYVYENNVKYGEGVVDPEGRFQGPWKIFYPTGEVKAEGSFVDGMKDGEWTYFFTNTKVEQRGSYTLDLPNGAWKWYYENGVLLREERFRKGKEDGLMVEYDREGNEISKGEFIDGLKTGPWIQHVNDHKEAGSYLDGEKHGEWVFYFDNEEVNFEGEFSVGSPIGKHRWFYYDGKLKKEGKYKSGEKHGPWKQYDEFGVLQMVIKYNYGEVIKIDGSKVFLASDAIEEVN